MIIQAGVGGCGVKRDYRGKSLAQYIIDIHSNLVFDWDKYFVVNAQPNAFAKYIMYFSNPIKLNTEDITDASVYDIWASRPAVHPVEKGIILE